jgi:hypothetical protein
MPSGVRQRQNAVQRFKDLIPWYAKIAAKIVLSRLPVSYDLWRRTSLFRHGAMDVPERAIAALRAVMEGAGLGPSLEGLSVLELGPGDSLATALVAHALGARDSVLIDVGDFARRDMRAYRALTDLLEAEGACLEAAKHAKSVDELLRAAHGQYLTGGLASLQSLAPGSIDFAFSSAVLEHIRVHEFRPMMRALRRAMASSARCIHNVDLQDHLAYGLNNLRFSDHVWESDFMARSGFYTNRIGFDEMLSIFGESGFSVEIMEVRRFPRLPIARRQMAARFRNQPVESLLVSGFSALLTPLPP